MEKVSPDDCLRFEAFSRLNAELVSAWGDDMFAYGFTMGMLLINEVWEQESIISDE